MKYFARLIIIVFTSGLLLLGTLPILAREIDETQVKPEKYARIVDVLPDNGDIVWRQGLPEFEDKIKIKKIVIDLSEQKMYLHENEKVVGEFSVSTGRPGMETPTGIFQIQNKFLRQWSKAAGLWMPYWMAVAPDGRFGIHELPEWPNGAKEGEDHLGQPVSHGCIRLGVGAAKTVYEWAEAGIEVEIRE